MRRSRFDLARAAPTAGLLSALCLVCDAAAAQVPLPTPPSDSLTARLSREASACACARALPPSAYVRVPVFVFGEVADSLDHAARPLVDLVAESVAGRMRVRAWGSADTAARADAAGRLPAADSVFGVRRLRGGVRVTARRGGAVTWAPVAPATASSDSAATRILVDAVAAVREAGELLVPDDAVRGDSLVFVLNYVHPVPQGPGGPLQRLAVRNPSPGFTLPVPWVRQAAHTAPLQINYPSGGQAEGFEGFVVLQFVVDTSGRAEPGSIRDRDPSVEAKLPGDRRLFYRAFVNAARDGVARARFVPASLGGCPVRQLVQLPVSFRLSR